MQNQNCLYTEKIIVILNKMELSPLDYFPRIQIFYDKFPFDYIENFIKFDDVWNSTNNIISNFFRKKQTCFSRKKYLKYMCCNDDWETIQLKKIDEKNFQSLKIIHLFQKIKKEVAINKLAIELPTAQFYQYIKDNNIDYKNIK